MNKGCLYVAVYFVCAWVAIIALTSLPGMLSHPAQLAYAPIVLTIAGGAIVIVIFLESKRRVVAAAERRAYEETAAAVAARNEEILEHIATLPKMPNIVPTGLTLGPNERCYLQAQASAMTPVTRTHYQGGYAGVGIPVFDTGLAVNVGRFASRPIPVTTVESKGQGTVYVTDQRIVWIGPHGSVVIPLGSVLNVSVFTDGAQIDSENSPPWLFQSGSVELAGIAYRATHG